MDTQYRRDSGSHYSDQLQGSEIDFRECEGLSIKQFDYSRFRVRKLTPTEYGRLQGFPMDTWRQVVSNSQAYKQFGNAVTVPLAEAIGKSIIEFLKEQEAGDGKNTAGYPG